MAKITYKGESDRVEWHGQAFERGKAVEVDNQALIEAASKHPFFSVGSAKATAANPPAPGSENAEEAAARKEAEALKARTDKARKNGVEAAEAEKPMVVPPAYRGKPEEQAWLDGYQGKPAEDGSDEQND